MAKFWELFAESVILQAILALMFGGTVCYMFLQGMEVPDTLVGFLGLIIGFYFGGKTTIAAAKLVKKGEG
jgi:hypothetical protein